MKGTGTNDTTLIDILTGRTREQRQYIRAAYQQQYSHDLIKAVEKDTSGNYKNLLVNLLHTRGEVRAHHLHWGMHGIGTRNGALIEVICTSAWQDLEAAKADYHRMYNKDLMKDVASETSMHFKATLEAILRNERRGGASDLNPAQVEEDARHIYNATEGRPGTNEKALIEIFTTRSPWHMQAVGVAYEQHHRGHSLFRMLEKETSGHFKEALEALCLPPLEVIADRLHHALARPGTDDQILIYAMTAHEKPELLEVARIYEAKHKKSLLHAIEQDTSFNYKRTLEHLLR